MSLDSYVLRARLLPALLALLPVVLTGATLFQSELAGWKSAYAVAISCGILFLFSELARQAGKKRQDRLYQSWGGKPSIAFLRHRDIRNAALRSERHRLLTILFPEIALPSPSDEARDSRRADDVYELLGNKLIGRTRDKTRFPLLFKENCSYGFWRNLWGLKPVGLITAISSLALVALAVFKSKYFGSISLLALVLPAVVDILFILLWIFWVKPQSVRMAAEAYAERLLEAGDGLLAGQGAADRS